MMLQLLLLLSAAHDDVEVSDELTTNAVSDNVRRSLLRNSAVAVPTTAGALALVLKRLIFKGS